MAITAPTTLYCSNLDCLSENPGSNAYCHVCGNKLLQRYLWVTGPRLPKLSPGNLVDDRYFVISPRVVLDTRPGEPPFCPEEDIPEVMAPYLRLFSYRPYIPQVYGFLSPEWPDCFLLEDAPLHGSESTQAGQVLPGLLDSWAGSSCPQQLGWLWQMSRIWNSLVRRQVGSTLLDLYSLRVDHSWVRCLELTLDDRSPSLSQLGEAWTALVPGTHPSLQPLLQQLILFLQTGKLSAAGDLIRFLELALDRIGQYQTYHVEISSATDPGPSRKSNEDSCFPAPGELLQVPPALTALGVVCDGLGGHEGGEVASELAVQIVVEDLNAALVQTPEVAPEQLIRRSIALANDAISHQNNQENREERRRMGTTLVSVFHRDHYTYLANVGDSRAYCVSQSGCRQLTVDDDLASRHTRMGLGIYRHTLEAPSAGALVQALGMVASQSLVSEMQRFYLSQDLLFVLCSDGVSDRDLLEQFWDKELLPVLSDRRSVQEAAQGLVDLANQHNGHDNVTAVVVKIKVSSQGEPTAQELLSILKVARPKAPEVDTPTQIRNPVSPASLSDGGESNPQPNPAVATSLMQRESSYSQPLVVVWGLLLLTIVGLALGTLFFAPLIRSGSDPAPSPTVSPSGP